MDVRRQTNPNWLICLWPGLPQLWRNGSWWGLVLAVSFAALVEISIATWIIWPELLAPAPRMVVAGLAGSLWLAALLQTRTELSRQALRDEGVAPAADLAEEALRTECLRRLREAQVAYLAGNWSAAETLLLLNGTESPDDFESQLLLATLWRRAGRLDDARRRLQRLARLDAAAPWRPIIDRQLDQIEKRRTITKLESESTAATSDTPTDVLPIPLASEQLPPTRMAA